MTGCCLFLQGKDGRNATPEREIGGEDYGTLQKQTQHAKEVSSPFSLFSYKNFFCYWLL
jgi:hypothetical protein